MQVYLIIEKLVADPGLLKKAPFLIILII